MIDVDLSATFTRALGEKPNTYEDDLLTDALAAVNCSVAPLENPTDRNMQCSDGRAPIPDIVSYGG